jgi:hypothetical protein
MSLYGGSLTLTERLPTLVTQASAVEELARGDTGPNSSQVLQIFVSAKAKFP